jgi:hypothetical protein
MFKKNKTNFEYESALEYYPEIIKKSSLNVPDWYKDTPRWVGNKIKGSATNQTFKQCSPFLDSLTIGYQLILPADLFIEKQNGSPYISWKPSHSFVKSREPEFNSTFPIPHGYCDMHFVWCLTGSFKVNKGYSFLFTHPLNRTDLPFYTLSGVVDGNYAMGADGNIPFFLKNDFEGVIPQGTPIAQIIPFKNEKWKLLNKKSLLKEGQLNSQKSHATVGWYKNNIWNKKEW